MAEAFIEQLLGSLGHVGATGATRSKERRWPGPLPLRVGQATADLIKRDGNLLLREPLHQLAQLVTLGAHDRQLTRVHLESLIATLTAGSQRFAPALNRLAPATSRHICDSWRSYVAPVDAT